MPVATCTYGHVLPGAVPVHTKHAAPHSSSIKIAYNPKHETFSQRVVRFMDSRPREKIVVYKPKPKVYGYEYIDGAHPVVINNISGKRGLPRDQVARLERRFSSAESPIVINNRVHPNGRYSYERERRIPPPPEGCYGLEPYRTVVVSPGPSRSPDYKRARVNFADEVCAAPPLHPDYVRPRVHFADNVEYMPNIIEVTHADDA